MQDRILTVRVTAIRQQTAEINAYELAHPRGLPLPDFEAGAHIDLHLPGGFMRQYSLVAAKKSQEEARRYIIGVKREPSSRGGSASLHDRVSVGDLLAISTPRNSFPLNPQANHHLLLAGGIGMTPMLAMAEELVNSSQPFTFCIFARSRAHVAFTDILTSAELTDHVQYHFDDPEAKEKINLAQLLSNQPTDTHAYICGPEGFMNAVLAAGSHWPEQNLHLEYFAVPEQDSASSSEPFNLYLTQQNVTVPVGRDQTAVQALHDVGINIPTSCEQGICGTCVIDYSEGEVDHRDFCLSTTERQSKIALCCSRAKSTTLSIEL